MKINIKDDNFFILAFLEGYKSEFKVYKLSGVGLLFPDRP